MLNFRLTLELLEDEELIRSTHERCDAETDEELHRMLGITFAEFARWSEVNWGDGVTTIAACASRSHAESYIQCQNTPFEILGRAYKRWQCGVPFEECVTITVDEEKLKDGGDA